LHARFFVRVISRASKRKETELARLVPIEQIKASGYHLDIQNPNVIDPGHADPDKLLLEHHPDEERGVIRSRC
ncbi:MAG: hypothetical protein MUC91_02275, partial [Verrucomicrobia bacterium]|nr:hypothetical protein [Verrucomicrobiota bacterium]